MDLATARDSERRRKQEGELEGGVGNRRGEGEIAEKDGSIITSEVKPLEVSESLPISRNCVF